VLGRHGYDARPARVPQDHFTLDGEWTVDAERATAGRRARIRATVSARRVFLVMSSRGDRARRVRVYVDGRLDRTVAVRGQRLYELVDLPRMRTGMAIELRVPSGVSGYAFTFG
jgi:hypothetical protein